MQNLDHYTLGHTYGLAWAMGHTGASKQQIEKACQEAVKKLRLGQAEANHFERGWKDALKHSQTT